MPASFVALLGLTFTSGCTDAPTKGDGGDTAPPASCGDLSCERAEEALECTETPDAFATALQEWGDSQLECTDAYEGYTSNELEELGREIAACETWELECEESGDLCAFTCAQRHGTAEGQCALDTDVEASSELVAACTDACDAALLVTEGDATWDGNARHTGSDPAPLTNRADVLRFVECSWETACSNMDAGYCYVSY